MPEAGLQANEFETIRFNLVSICLVPWPSAMHFKLMRKTCQLSEKGSPSSMTVWCYSAGIVLLISYVTAAAKLHKQAML